MVLPLRGRARPNRATLAVATIAHNFTDHPPSTSEREALFSAELHLPDFLRAAVAANRRALGLPPQCQVCDAIGCTEHEVSPEHEVSRA